MSSTPNAIGSSTMAGPSQPHDLDDTQKRIDYFRKCSKVLVPTDLPFKLDMSKTPIPDTVSPDGCGWRFVMGPDPENPYNGSKWTLVLRPGKGPCSKPPVPADPAYEACPTPERRVSFADEQKPVNTSLNAAVEQPTAATVATAATAAAGDTSDEQPATVATSDEQPATAATSDEQPATAATSDEQPATVATSDEQDAAAPSPPEVIEEDPIETTPTGREEVKLSGRSFYIDYDKAARARRQAVFSSKSSSENLTDSENELLETVGIVDSTRDSLKSYLPDFFNALPSCQSTTTMLTNKRCEIAYYVMWSVLLKARQDVQRRIEQARLEGLPDNEVYQLEARLNAMSNVKGRGSGSDSQTFQAVSKLADNSHREHAELDTILKRIDGKIDVIKTNVNGLKRRT